FGGSAWRPTRTARDDRGRRPRSAVRACHETTCSYCAVPRVGAAAALSSGIPHVRPARSRAPKTARRRERPTALRELTYYRINIRWRFAGPREWHTRASSRPRFVGHVRPARAPGRLRDGSTLYIVRRASHRVARPSLVAEHRAARQSQWPGPVVPSLK